MYTALTSQMSTLIHTIWLKLTAGLIQRYDEAEAEVYNALITLIRDTTVLREYAAAALFIMQVCGVLWSAGEAGPYPSSRPHPPSRPLRVRSRAV